jgi:hypothetical protein
MIRFALLAALTLGLAACNGTSSRPAEEGEYNPLFNSYFQDPRTKICYSVSVYDRTDIQGKAASGMSHTAVPCSPEVMGLLRDLPRAR